MLDALRSYLESPQLAEDPFIRLDSFTFIGSGGVLELSVMDFQGRETWKRWRVEVSGLRDYEVREAGGDLTLQERDHVLARQHTDTRQKLTFQDKPRSVSETIGHLLIAHREAANDWIPFDRYINASCPLDELLAGGHGELADGPSFLVEAYADVLTRAGVRPSLLAKHGAMWWDGRQWLDTERSLATLLLGDAYFVARNFNASELPADGG